MGQNMRQNALSGPKGTCPVCGAMFVKNRRWQAFCSTKCRKVMHQRNQRTIAYYDVRKELEGIRESLRAIESKLGI